MPIPTTTLAELKAELDAMIRAAETAERRTKRPPQRPGERTGTGVVPIILIGRVCEPTRMSLPRLIGDRRCEILRGYSMVPSTDMLRVLKNIRNELEGVMRAGPPAVGTTRRRRRTASRHVGRRRHE